MAVPLLGAPAQRCGIAKQEQVEEDHNVQLEEDGKYEAVSGCRFVCLMQIPSLSQREDSRGLSWLWSLFMIAMKWVDVAGRKIRPRVFGW